MFTFTYFLKLWCLNYILVLNDPADVLGHFWPQKNQPKKEIIIITFLCAQCLISCNNTCYFMHLWLCAINYKCSQHMKVIQLYKLLMGGVWRTFWSLCTWSNFILDVGAHCCTWGKESHNCLGSHASCTCTLKSCKRAAWSHSSPVHCRLDTSGDRTCSNTCSCKSCCRKNIRGSKYCCYTSC